MSVRLWRTAAATVLLTTTACLSPLRAQNSQPAMLPTAITQAQISFAFERHGLSVPKFVLTIRDDGSGIYEGEEVQQPTNSEASVPPPQKFNRPLNITQPTVKRVFNLAKQLNRFNTNCTSKAKNIADTGAKILTYSGPDGLTGSCTYNGTDSKDVQALTDIFQGISETLDEGRKLDYLHRYDRLGLDEATSFLAEEVSDGRALEVGTIAVSLRSIASDANVMERVRTRAKSLLSAVPPDSH